MKFSRSNAKNRTTVRDYAEAEQKKPRLVKNDFSKEFGAETEDMLDRLAKRGGAQIEIVESIADGSAGKYLDGKIQISAEKLREDREGTLRAVVMHEMTHHIETSGQYEQLKSGIESYLKSKGVDVDYELEILAEEYEANGVDLLQDDQIWREYVAKNVETLLSDEDSVRYLARENRNLFDKIRQFLRDLVTKIKGTKDEKTVRELLKIYDHALDTVDAYPENRLQGEQHLFVRANNAETAETMEREGKSLDEIWQATGMIRDAKGNWVTEIDDSGMKYHSSGDAVYRQMHPDYEEYRTLELRLLYEYGMESWTEEDQKRFDKLHELYKNEPKRLRAVLESDGATLSDILQHDALFESYPQLRSAKMRFADLGPSTRGRYNSDENVITLDKSLRRRPEATLLHEIQHAIQDAEGRPGGASPKYWQRQIDGGKTFGKNDGKIREADEKYRSLFDRAPDALKNKIRELNRVHLAGDTDTAERIVDELYAGEYADLYSEIDMADFDRRMLRDYNEPLDAGDLYHNTAGEIEARAAASRKGLTAGERRKKTPDFGWDRAVFAEDGTKSFEVAENGFAEDKYFARKVDHWQELNRSGRTRVGRLSNENPLTNAGMLDAYVYIDNSKLMTELERHGDHLTPEMVKKIPALLSDPIMLNDPSIGKPKLRGSIDVFGDLTLADGTPVLVGVTIAKDQTGNYTINKVQTIHARRNWMENVSDASVLYLNPNKKRTNDWFHNRGTDVPLGGTQFGSIRSITDFPVNYNGNTAQNSGQTSVGRSIDELRAQGQQMTPEERKAYVDASRARRAKLRDLADQYGEIPQGERPAREISLPKQTDDTHKVSQTMRTILAAGATPDALVLML